MFIYYSSPLDLYFLLVYPNRKGKKLDLALALLTSSKGLHQMRKNITNTRAQASLALSSAFKYSIDEALLCELFIEALREVQDRKVQEAKLQQYYTSIDVVNEWREKNLPLQDSF